MDWTSSVPFLNKRIHAAAMYCSDGRIGEQCDDLCQNALGLPRYDRLVVPGGAACLAGHPEIEHEEHASHEELRFLIDVHAIERVVLIAHEGCAFYSHRLRVKGDDLRARQIDDLALACRHVQQLASSLCVEAFYAAIQGDRVRFERVEI